MGRPIIEVRNITKCYRLGLIGMTSLRDDIERFWRSLRGGATSQSSKAREFWALKGVTFSVDPGEVVGIIGRNGAGKSTLLKVLSRITEPTDGEIILRGRVASLLEVGTGFHPELSGRDNIFLNGAMLGMSRREIERKFDEILAFSEVEKFIDTPVKRYSSGMYVKLAFSVAAHLEPEILVIDEVLAVGDVAFQRKCVGRMSEVAKSGRTVLFVSHNFGLVQSLCSKGVYLSQGTVEKTGPISDVLALCLKTYEISGSESLENRADRAGAGQVRLKRFDTRNASGVTGGVVVTGERAAIRAELSSPRERAGIVVRAYDSNNVLIFSLNSSMRGARDAAPMAKVSSFECDIDELSIAPGRYRLDVEAWVAGVKQDAIEGIAYLEVGDGQYDGRMIRGSKESGIAPVRHSWSFSD